jgi:short-subunit dehydrogenase
MDLNGKRVVITGASRGIGAEIAKEFAAAGSQVILSARTEDAISGLANEVNGIAIPFDANDSEDVRTYIDRVEANAGPIDVLINNAGIEKSTLIEDITEEEIEETLRVNLITPQILTAAVLPKMLSRGSGHLVYTSSIAATTGNPAMSAYCSSKAGLTRYAESLRMELRYTPLNVSILHLGPVDTVMWDGIDTDPLMKRGVDRFMKLGFMAVADPIKVAKATAKAVEKNKSEVRLPRRMAVNAALNGISTKIFGALLTGIDIRKEAGKEAVTKS